MITINQITVLNVVNRKIVEVILAIVVFILLFLIIAGLSIGITIGCAYLGYMVLHISLKIYELALTALLWTISFSILLFLVKFLFTISKDENPHRVEIHPQDHPGLFKLIAEVSEEVGTDLPKKVFFSHSVNACVFYNSSFWSLFFRSKKNLEIGLGLFNSINVEELRAILSHEFGHFSQKTMRLGSYVYTVNKKIFNIVYNYNTWEKIYEAWSEKKGIFKLVFGIVIFMVKWVSPLLKKAYSLINLPYMKLSREMEFHADQISAVVAGKENTISAMRRLEFGDVIYSQTLRILTELSQEQKISVNIYPNHTELIRRYSKYYKIQLEDGLPIITDRDIEDNYVKRRVIFEDQWASHPSIMDRVTRINALGEIPGRKDSTSSWSLLDSAEEWQKKLTHHLYAVDLGDLGEFDVIGQQEFLDYIAMQRSKFTIDKRYHEFYTNRYLYPLQPTRVKDFDTKVDMEKKLQETYSRKSKLKFERLDLDYVDLQTLQNIKNKVIRTRFFEFDNIKYHRSEIDKIIERLEQEIEEETKGLKKLERKAFRLNVTIASRISPDTRDKLVMAYQRLIDFQKTSRIHEVFLDRISIFQQELFFNPPEKGNIPEGFNLELSNLEKDYKSFLEELKLESYDNISPSQLELLKTYQEGHFYLRISTFDQERLNNFIELIYGNHDFISNKYLMELKMVTEYQKGLYKKLKLSWEDNSLL